CSDVAREHADVHPDVALRLRLERVMQREEPRAGARFDDSTMEPFVSVVQAAVIGRNRAAGLLKLGVQVLEVPHQVSALGDRKLGGTASAHPLERTDDVEQLVDIVASQ